VTASLAKIPTEKTRATQRVSKRPSRGYHTFKNRLLNITPKKDEEDQVTANQQAPLLRLPTEIREQIWSEVLGGKTFQQTYNQGRNQPSKFRPNRDRKHGLALPLTCRQIYAETASMPYK
ncbi:hypothetical protein CC80DRAFT_379871, partial [Byssothecium circinans]